MYFLYIPIEHGDIPASYVIVYQRVSFEVWVVGRIFFPNDEDCMGRVIVCLPTALP